MNEDFLDIGLMSGDDIARLVSDDTDNGNTHAEENKKQPEKKVEEPKNEEPKNPPETNATASNSSSLAAMFQEAGFFRTIDKEKLEKLKDLNDFSNLIDEEIENRYNNTVDVKTKRIEEFMSYGAKPNEVQFYESNIEAFEGISDNYLDTDESEEANKLRQDLIRLYYKQKGLDDDEANDMVQRSMDSGKEIDDAKKAKNALLKAYKSGYENYKKSLEKQREEYKKKIEDENSKFASSVINDNELFDQFGINKQTRQKIVDVVQTADKDGKSEIQRYSMEHPLEFYKYLGMFYVLTDGFKDVSKVFSNAVNKQVNKKVNALEALLRNTTIANGNPMSFKSGTSQDIPNIDMSSLQLDEDE